MKAWTLPRYGAPDVLELRDVPVPQPKPDEVLVRTRAASVNPAEWHVMRGDPYFLRFVTGWPRPRIPVFGTDVAGVVEQVGSQVDSFFEGDEVFADVEIKGRGGLSEFAAVPQRLLAHKPKKASWGEAASMPVAGTTALQALRDWGSAGPGDRVLVNGACGGVGSFAVQIAKSMGADVTAVVSTKKVAVAKHLGADQVIDYTKEDFTASGPYDVVIDTACQDVARGCQAIDDGTYVHVGGSMSAFYQGMLKGRRLARPGRYVTRTAKADGADLKVLATLVDDGQIKPLIDRTFAFEEAPEAMAYLEAGHATGKVVVRVAPE